MAGRGCKEVKYQDALSSTYKASKTLPEHTQENPET